MRYSDLQPGDTLVDIGDSWDYQEFWTLLVKEEIVLWGADVVILTWLKHSTLEKLRSTIQLCQTIPERCRLFLVERAV